MILYFSGTGNSKYVAQQIAQITGDEIISLNERIKAHDKGDVHAEVPFVFICPTYAWRIPRIVEDYIRSAGFSGSRKAYFILTCGGNTLNAVSYVSSLCRDLGFQLLGFAEVLMPENYIALYEAPEQDEADQIIADAQSLISRLALDIMEGRAFPDFTGTGGVKGLISSGIVNRAFYRFIVRADGFRATQSCSHCGACAGLCPLNNIELREGSPLWGKRCTHCMACICGCPAEAIEYKNHTKGKKRYYLSV